MTSRQLKAETFVDCTECGDSINAVQDNYVDFGSEKFSEIGTLGLVCAACIIDAYRELNGCKMAL